MRSDGLIDLLSPVAEQFGIDLEEVDVTPAGKRRLVRVVVDGDGPEGHGLLLDDIAEATKAISATLDESDLMGSGAYTLEVSSRGVSRPLTLSRHWRRNRGRLVRASLSGGETVLGRVVASDDDTVLLQVEGEDRRLELDNIAEALVQIEMNRKTQDEEG